MRAVTVLCCVVFLLCLVRDGIVQLTWGSALVGHWGCQLAPEGTVRNLEKGHGTALRVPGDIQFIYTD